MINNNKILTVSYGTFSCTLEGFDDSFGTMKAIAEYFRGLASDDRYFGAEPPQPDAEMLQRIAQKEISRRVEAREHEGKIVLSATDEDAKTEGAKSAAPLSIAAPAAAVVAAATQQSVSKAPPADEGETADVETSDAAPVEDVMASVAAPEVAPAEAIAPEAAILEVAEDDAQAADPIANVTAQIEDENDVVPGQPDADVEAFFDSPAANNVAEPEVAVAEPIAAAAPASDSIAAKLQRIRAVVAQHDDEEDEDDYSEDEHAEGDSSIANASADVMADAHRDIEDALDADEIADAEMADDDDIDEIADILNRLENGDALADADDTASGDTQDATDQVMADVQPEDDTAEEEDALENLFDDEKSDSADTSGVFVLKNDDENTTSNVIASAGLTLEVTPDAAAPLEVSPLRARVIKVKRADLEAAIENGELEEYDDGETNSTPLGLDDLAPARTTGSSLSAADEDELARELAELEADMKLEHAPAAVADVQRTEDLDDDSTDDVIAAALENIAEATHEDAPNAARTKLPAIDEAQSDDLGRLLAEADHQMDEPESATRRDAFAHLRAAVASKKADEALGQNDDTVGGDDAYRNDLADVVRPRRPVSSDTRTKRPGEGRPAPLKLVAEQRIDVAKTAQTATGPVRPRRVAAVEAQALETEGESFVDFATEMGATKLPDLLEAAAAYMSFVEGREQFSRPQLMTKVRQAGPDGFSREDTLRSFGKLLRDGKIEKIKAGRFAASEEIGFRPNERAAG